MHRQFEDLGLAAQSGELQIALSAVDFPEQVRAARDPAAVVHRESCSALEQSADAHLIIRGPGFPFALSRNREVLRRTVMVAESSRTSPRQWHMASAAW